MARIKGGVTSKARHKKIIKQAKGYRGRAKNCYRVAIEKVAKASQYAYRDRRTKKRTFRALWIIRINAAARVHGITYSQLINGLMKAGIVIDRKILSDLAIKNPQSFTEIVNKAEAALAA